MRKKIVAGNWKMNTTVKEGVELVKAIAQQLNRIPEDVQLVVAPPLTHLSSVNQTLIESGCSSQIALGAQNCANKEKGAYTGEVSANMLATLGDGTNRGVEYVIIGHSERRGYYGETNEILLEKVRLALAAGLKVIYCVGEELSQREAGVHFDFIAEQIKEVLFPLSQDELKNIIVAYEPIWAIGTGVTATSAQAQEIHAFIRKTIAEKYGDISEQIPILYGGSCKPSNAAELFAQKDIDGGLIGGASLKADDFIGIASSF